MRPLRKLCEASWQLNKIRTGFFNYASHRGLKFQVKVKWVHPGKKPLYHPSISGDLNSFSPIEKSIPSIFFQKSEELKTADENVKKVFSLNFQDHIRTLQMYEKELVDKVKAHMYDDSSLEVQIAKLTAKIRFYQNNMEMVNKKLGARLKVYVEKRNKKLKLLRKQDYKKFEWLLQELDLTYRPVVDEGKVVKRKEALARIVRLEVEKQKEAQIAALKKEYDEKKIPFLIQKAEKLKWIKEMEEKYNLPKTVNEHDIEDCMKKLEQVKIEVAERQRRGYVRKIHPYLLEPFDEQLLLEKELAHLKKEDEEQKAES